MPKKTAPKKEGDKKSGKIDVPEKPKVVITPPSEEKTSDSKLAEEKVSEEIHEEVETKPEVEANLEKESTAEAPAADSASAQAPIAATAEVVTSEPPPEFTKSDEPVIISTPVEEFSGVDSATKDNIVENKIEETVQSSEKSISDDDSKAKEVASDIPTQGNGEVSVDESVDKDSGIKSVTDIPTVDHDAPLKIDEIRRKVDTSVAVDEKVNNENPNGVGKNNLHKIIILSSLSLGIVLCLAVFLFLQFSGKKDAVVKPPAAEEFQETKKVEKEKLVKEEWKIEVLNGSGVKGRAKEVADQVEELGFEVVNTGNADNSDYEKSELYITNDMKSKKDVLLEELQKEISDLDYGGELEEDLANARIIVGINE